MAYKTQVRAGTVVRIGGIVVTVSEVNSRGLVRLDIQAPSTFRIAVTPPNVSVKPRPDGFKSKPKLRQTKPDAT